MCHASVIFFALKNLDKSDIEGKRIIDVGSHNYNGNLSLVAEKMNPREYVGVDMIDGPGVDVVCLAEDLEKKFGKESFDVVLSNELMEHARNWRDVISNMKSICKPGGVLLLTTRSRGFKIHAYPHDYWRYEIEDMERIFSDFNIEVLIKDPQAPGVLLRARKPENFTPNKLEDIELFSVVKNERVNDVTDQDVSLFIKREEKKKRVVSVKNKVQKIIFYPLKKLFNI